MQKTFFKLVFCWHLLRSMKKIEGSGSLSQMHGSADPDPHKNVMDPQYCFLQMYRIRSEELTCRGSL
jgi:hypothetical protein